MDKTIRTVQNDEGGLKHVAASLGVDETEALKLAEAAGSTDPAKITAYLRDHPAARPDRIRLGSGGSVGGIVRVDPKPKR